MRIAVVVKRFPVVSQTFVSDHVAGLQARGHEVTVFSSIQGFGAGGKLRRLLRVLGLLRAPLKVLRALRLGSPLGLRWSLLLASSDLAMKDRFDICHAHFAGDGDSMAWLRAAGMLDCPLVVSVHGYDIMERRHGEHPRYRFLFQHASAVIATTKFMAEATERLGCPRSRLQIMPSGIDIDRFEPRVRTWQPGAPLHLLSVGRLVEVKGIEYAIRAVALLRDTGMDVHYSVVGDGPLRDELEALVRQLGLTTDVTFHGAQPRENLLGYFARHHLFLFPSCTSSGGAQEAQGLVVVEAQASALPVVASRSGGIPEVMQDGRTGILIPEKNPDALAAAVRQLADRCEDWPAMGRAGRAWAEQNFRHDVYLSKTEHLYRGLLK